jgi:hypothetical protein
MKSTPETGIRAASATDGCLPQFPEATLIEVKPSREKTRLDVGSSIGGFQT